MDEQELQDAIEDILDDSGLSMDVDHFTEGIRRYLVHTGEQITPDGMLRVAHALTAAQGSMRAQSWQPQQLLGEWTLFGALEPVRCAMQRRRGESPRSFKQAFPTMWDKVGQLVGGKAIAVELLDFEPSRSYSVYSQSWAGGERVVELPGLVLMLGIPTSIFDDLPRAQRSLLPMMQQSSLQSGHPVVEDRDVLTVGWSRLGVSDRSVMVEEVQSDWFAARSQMDRTSPGMRDQLPFDYRVMNGLIDAVLAQLGSLQADLLGAAFHYACSADVSTVEMPGWEARSAVSALPPPRSPYERLPRRFGMQPRDGSSVAQALPLLRGCRFWSLSI